MYYGYDGPFWGCTGLKSVISEIQNPPVFDQSTFGSYSEDIYSNALTVMGTGTWAVPQEPVPMSSFFPKRETFHHDLQEKFSEKGNNLWFFALFALSLQAKS